MNDIALLIPVFNNKIGLLETINSIHPDNEIDIIIVDDGSSPKIDLNGEITTNHNITLKRLDKNKGIHHALNYGLNYILENNKYKYVARIDCGDIAHPLRFIKQKEHLENNTDTMLVGSYVDFIDNSGNVDFTWKGPLEYDAIRNSMHLNSCFMHPSVMFRVDAVKSLGLYSDEYIAAEDYEFFFRIITNYKSHNINEVLTKIENNPNGISLSKRKQQLKSRLKIQIKYFQLSNIYSYVGVMKTLMLLITPKSFVQQVKKLIY